MARQLIRIATPITLDRLKKVLDAYGDDVPTDAVVRSRATDLIVEAPEIATR